MRRTILVLALATVIIVSLTLLLPSASDLQPIQGMIHYTRNGQKINGNATWRITEIDPAYFSYLSNVTIINLVINGNLTDSKNGTVYINDHLFVTLNTSQRVYNETVPVDFCKSTTDIKIVSEEWDVKSVDLVFYVRIQQFPPWWKENLFIIFFLVFAEIAIVIISARKVIKWVRAG